MKSCSDEEGKKIKSVLYDFSYNEIDNLVKKFNHFSVSADWNEFLLTSIANKVKIALIEYQLKY